MQLIVREARPCGADDQIVGNLLVQAFVETYSKKMPEVVVTEKRRLQLMDVAMRRSQGTVLVAQLGDQIIGSVTLLPPGAAQSEAWIPQAADLRQLAVSPEFQGRGFAENLLTETEKLALSWNASAICLHVRRKASGLASLYRRRGYLRDNSGDLHLSSTAPGTILDGYYLPVGARSARSLIWD